MQPYLALHQWMKGKLFWLTLITLSLSMEGVALFYQYVMKEPPCILCIHFRLLFVVIILLALIGLWFRQYKPMRLMVSASLLATFAVMTERAYQLLGTERRFILSECGTDLNFPVWLAVDQWLPWLFKPMTSCGYTPELVLGVTMAEALMLFSIVMLMLSVGMLVTVIRDR